MSEVTEKRPSVLLVEDEPMISDLATEALVEQGFHVEAVSNAGEALRHLERGSAVDILFTDINLAGGMDGARLARCARALRPDLRVLYTSGRVSMREITEKVEGSMFVSKPYNPFDLGRLMEYLVGKRVPPSTNPPKAA